MIILQIKKEFKANWKLTFTCCMVHLSTLKRPQTKKWRKRFLVILLQYSKTNLFDRIIHFPRDWKKLNSDVSPLYPWHCDYMAARGQMLRLPPYTAAPFHPFETNGMLDPGPFHLLPQIPFSHPFNLDNSFHTTVCTSPGSTMNPGLPPCLPHRLLSGEKPTARGKPFVTYLWGGWMALSFDLYRAIFPSHPIFLSHTFQMWQK